jgi:hypothetical protein
MSIDEDDLKRRLSVLEARTRKLEERNGLLTAILALTLVIVFLAALQRPEFIYSLGTVALAFAIVILVLFLGWRILQPWTRKARE